ncbi:MAG: hypothetical protein U1E65_10985 [Myxococcota bacterium]
MRAALLLLFLGVSGPAAADTILEAGGGARAALVVLSVGNPQSAGGLEGTAAAAFQAATRLRLEPGAELGLSAAIVAACDPRALLSCMVREVRGELAQYLLFVSIRGAAAGKVRASALFLDLSEARAILSRPRSPTDGPERAENELYRASFEPAAAEFSPGEPAEYFQRLARSLVVRRPDLARLGAISVPELDAEASIALDDRPLGRAGPGSLTIQQVLPGPHQLVARSDAGSEASAEVLVPLGQVAEVNLSLGRAAIARSSSVAPSFGAVRTGLTWGGALVAGAGISVAIAGAVLEGQRQVVCISHRGSAQCPSFGALSAAASLSALPTADRALANPSGIRVMPFGLALLSAGATWSATTLLFGDEAEIPWVQGLVGVAVGAMTYGLAVAASD